ncbi:MAG: EVE domain-containing protein [Thermoplasmata archaeon]
MARWLLKEDPESYRYSDLVRDRRTEWTGVHNALALRHLRAMRSGDEAIMYHSGSEHAAVGILQISSEPHPDPHDERGSWTVEVRPVRALDHPVPLERLKHEAIFSDSPLVRIGRLSVLPLTAAQWDRLLALE